MIFLPLSTSVEELSALSARGFSLGIELPRVFFGREEAVRTKLKQLWDMDIRHARVGNWGALALAQELGFFCHGAFGLNLFNTSSLEFCREHGLIDAEISFELSLAQARALGGSLPRGILTYGRLPMMLTRNCPCLLYTSSAFLPAPSNRRVPFPLPKIFPFFPHPHFAAPTPDSAGNPAVFIIA